MKKIIPLLLCFAALTGYSQAQTDVLSAAQKLIDEKKYESAYVLLDKDDPNNEKPDVVLLKEDILMEQKDYRNALKYYEMADKLIPDNYYNLQPMLKLYLVTDDKKATAKEYFLKAKDLFKQVFKRDHDVFGVIDEVLETL